ncbi:MAG: hypothetical protein QXY82_02000 [Desulfurococcaceae archaeon]
MSHGRGSKGISTVIASFLLSMVILVVFTYVFLSIVASTQSGSLALKNVIRYSHKHEIAQLIANKSVDRTYLLNIGASDIAVDKVVVRTSDGFIEVRDFLDVCSGSNTIRAQEEAECSVEYDYIAVITVEGVVIYPQVPKPVIETLIQYSSTTYMVSLVFNITNPEELSSLFDVSDYLVDKPYTRVQYVRGVKSDKLLLLPPGQESEFYNATLEADNIPFGVVVVGYDPSWIREKSANPAVESQPRFIIMIAGPGFTGSDSVRINNRNYPLSGNGFRIVIRNYTGVIEIRQVRQTGNWQEIGTIACSSTIPGYCPSNYLPAIGAWYYGSTDRDLNLRLYLNGFATYIARFMRIASGNAPTGETNYYPFLFTGDIDGNGLVDLIFITEDAYYGDKNRINDMYGSDDLSDWSTEPLVIKLLQVGRALGYEEGYVDGGRFAGLALYINLFFHDNSHPDETQLEDIDRTDWVLRILLIDEYGNEYVVREYRYQEICNYHKTRVTNFGKDNYFVKISQSIYIPIPSAGKYWVAIALQDPYGTGRTNDADVTIGIEFIGVLPFIR